jgi:hypothetical protein
VKKRKLEEEQPGGEREEEEEEEDQDGEDWARNIEFYLIRVAEIHCTSMFLVNSFSMTAIQLYHQLLFYYLKQAYTAPVFLIIIYLKCF